MPMTERYPEAELVLDDELMYDDAPRRSAFLRREERPEDVVREGEVLAGKYRVERIPGRNGLGVVVQVRHMELGQEVTLKFLVPEACAYPEFVQRFVREARSAVRIQGEHVARVTDVGRLESGAPYMVREYLRGPDLAEVLKVRGPLPISEAVDYIIQACEGVAEGHALGVVHRNLRPTSLVVARRSDGTALVKVFDFAAAESLHVNPFTERAVSLVGTSAIMASLPYLAPEQIRDPHDVDFRADVYSLGAVLFELLSGAPVYAADAAPALLAQVAADAAPSLRTLRQDAPGELDHIVLRCLAKNRAIRYPSVAEFVLALGPFASHEATSSIERIVRLGKRTSKLPEVGEGRIPSPLPPAPIASIPPRRVPQHDDVTTINPYAAYAAPVIIKTEPVRAEAAHEPVRAEPARVEPARVEPMRTEPVRERTITAPFPGPLEPLRRTPQPPPMRASVPPPLRSVSQAPEAVVAPLPISIPPEARPETTALPPPSAVPASVAPRSSMSGLSRSWAVPEVPTAPLFTQRRLLAVGAIAACATLGAVLAARSSHSAAPAAAAALPVAAPAKVEPPPAPQPPPAPAEAAAPVASTSAVVAAAAPPAPVTAAPVAAAPAAPAPVVAAAPAPRATPVPAPVVAKAAPAPRRLAAREDAPPETSRKTVAAADQKVASSRPPSGGDMFDDPR